MTTASQTMAQELNERCEGTDMTSRGTILDGKAVGILYRSAEVCRS